MAAATGGRGAAGVGAGALVAAILALATLGPVAFATATPVGEPGVDEAGWFEATGSLSVARDGSTVTALADGRVLVAGGFGDEGFLASTETWIPR
jgi:hypothetical protein